MRRSRLSPALAVVTLALAGVGLGHVAEYVLLAPDHHQRHELLERTGHHYFPPALNAAVFVALLALALLFLAGVGRGLGWTGPRQRFVAWSRALPVAQGAAFIALEVGERLAAGASLGDLGLVLAVGVPIQALVGFLAGRLVTGVETAGEVLGQRVRAACLPAGRRPRPAAGRPGALFRRAPAVLGAPLPARGPPSALVPA